MRTGAKAAVQGRSRQTRDRLLQALEALLREQDFSRIGVADIARRAGVSPASIYQRFSNKDAAVSILIELYMRAVADWTAAHMDEVRAIFAAPTLREALLGLGRLSWRQFEDLRHVMRPAYLASRLRPDLLGEQWRVQLARMRADFATLLGARRAEIRRADLPRAADMIAAFYNMMFLGRLLHADDFPSAPGAGEDDAEAFARELADFACGYLAVDDRPRSES